MNSRQTLHFLTLFCAIYMLNNSKFFQQHKQLMLWKLASCIPLLHFCCILNLKYPLTVGNRKVGQWMQVISDNQQYHFSSFATSFGMQVPQLLSLIFLSSLTINHQLKMEFSLCADDSLFGSMDHITKFVATRFSELYDKIVSYPAAIFPSYCCFLFHSHLYTHPFFDSSIEDLYLSYSLPSTFMFCRRKRSSEGWCTECVP